MTTYEKSTSPITSLTACAPSISTIPRMATRSPPQSSSSTSRLEASLPAACASLLSLRNAPTYSPHHTSASLSTHTVSPISVIGQTNLSTTSITTPTKSLDASPTSNISIQKPPASRFWETVLADTPPPPSLSTNRKHSITQPPSNTTTPSSQHTTSNSNNNNNNNNQNHTTTRSSRTRHTLFSTTDDESSKMNIPCVLCGVRFRKPGHLNMHWRSVHATSSDAVYPGKLPHMKIMAPLQSQQQNDLTIPLVSNAHINSIETNVGRKDRDITKSGRAYGCPQCDARFRRGSDRNRHMRMVHAKIRPFECKLCGNHFGRKSFLEAHILTVHQKLRPFRCECGAAFGQRSSLTRHTRKIHGREP